MDKKIIYKNGIIIEKINNHSIQCTLDRHIIEKFNLKASDILHVNKNSLEIIQFIVRNSKNDFDFIPRKFPLSIKFQCADSNKMIFTISENTSKKHIIDRYLKRIK